LTASAHSQTAGAAASGDVLARTVHLQRLLDVYGPLLTEHQRLACRLHLDQDWSFSELAEHLGCSRSGAYDLVRRALAQLARYEASLGHAAELARRDVVEEGLRARVAHLASRSRTAV
jgi:predicted DNA-binding protein YlxM (UPF0122 family)